MKKKIICIGIVSMFLLTGITTVSAIGINKEAFNENSDETITVQTFYDMKIKNYKWDEGESAAPGMHIWAGDEMFFLRCIFTYKGQTNSDGTLTFTIPKGWTDIYLSASQSYNIQHTLYKGYAKKWAPQDGSLIRIPIRRVESYSAAKTTTASNTISTITTLR